jgi:hypothetical protein
MTAARRGETHYPKIDQQVTQRVRDKYNLFAYLVAGIVGTPCRLYPKRVFVI